MKQYLLFLKKHLKLPVFSGKILIKKVLFLLFLFLLYGTVFFFRYEIQAQLFFPGVRLNTLNYTGSGVPDSDLKFEEINIRSLSGENINGLYVEAGISTIHKKTIYYFHGNGGDLRYFYPTFKFLSDLGYNVLAFDYPGYGKSSGFPYNYEISDAANQFYQKVQKDKGFQDKDVIAWGYSIGSGIATHWAQGRNISAVVLVAAYTSFYDLSREHYNYALQKLLFLPNSFVSSKNIHSLKAPILFLHGNKDTLISIDQGRKLFQENSKNAYFLEIEDGTHFDILETPFIQFQIEDFLKTQTLSQKYIYAYRGIPIPVVNTGAVFDFESDTSLTKYVDPTHSFQLLSYIPSDLESLGKMYIVDTKGNALLRMQARIAFESLASAFYKQFGEKIPVVSSYRSYSYQVGIKSGGCPDTLCAKAGYSEHQSGLALDLWEASSNDAWKSSSRLTKFYTWLSKNAAIYGFHNSYQKGISVDGYEIEPWHWRYLGVDLAKSLQEKNMSFSEYYAQKNSSK